MTSWTRVGNLVPVQPVFWPYIPPRRPYNASSGPSWYRETTKLTNMVWLRISAKCIRYLGRYTTLLYRSTCCCCYCCGDDGGVWGCLRLRELSKLTPFHFRLKISCWCARIIIIIIVIVVIYYDYFDADDLGNSSPCFFFCLLHKGIGSDLLFFCLFLSFFSRGEKNILLLAATLLASVASWQLAAVRE